MGFRTAVAPQGTAFKDTQADTFFRSRPKGIVCLLDGDSAGQKAALSYVSTFLKVGLEARLPSFHRYGSRWHSVGTRTGSHAEYYRWSPAYGRICGAAKNTQAHCCITETKGIGLPMDVLIVGRYRFSYCPEGYIEQLGRLLSVPIDALKVDLARFRKPAHRLTQSTDRERSFPKVPDRLTLLKTYCSSFAWRPTRQSSCPHAWHIVGWLASSFRSYTCKNFWNECWRLGTFRSQIEDLLEDDQERDLYHRLVMQEIKKMNSTLITTCQTVPQCPLLLILKDRKTLSLLS